MVPTKTKVLKAPKGPEYTKDEQDQEQPVFKLEAQHLSCGVTKHHWKGVALWVNSIGIWVWVSGSRGEGLVLPADRAMAGAGGLDDQPGGQAGPLAAGQGNSSIQTV